MTVSSDPQAPLREFVKRSDFFIGVDSDGCVFDTMEVKHKECFIPNMIRTTGLAAITRLARETFEWINLYSKWRGTNRFPGLVMTIDFWPSDPKCYGVVRGCRQLTGLREWIGRETKLANPTLKAEARSDRRSRPGPGTRMERGRQPLDRRDRQGRAAISICARVARTHGGQGRRDGRLGHSGEALEREWDEHGLREHVALIAGQECGSKKEHLALDRRRPLRTGEYLDGRRRPRRLERREGQWRALLSDRPGL